MAEYKTRIDDETGITFVEVTGVIVLEEHVPYMHGPDYQNRTSRLVADVRQASLDGMSRGTIAKMVRSVKPLGREDIVAAYVLNNGEDFAKGKAMLAQLETLGYKGKFKIFSDIDKAIAWVKAQ